MTSEVKKEETSMELTPNPVCEPPKTAEDTAADPQNTTCDQAEINTEGQPPVSQVEEQLQDGGEAEISCEESVEDCVEESSNEPLSPTAEEQTEVCEAQNEAENIPMAEEQNQQESGLGKCATGGIVLKPLHLAIGSFFVVVLVIASIFFGMWLVERDRDSDLETNVKDYHDIYASAADIAAGNLAAPGYTEVTLPANMRNVEIILPNPQGNPCYFRYSLILKDTGEVLYRSGLIEPGKAVTEIQLSRALEQGRYRLQMWIETSSLEDRSAMNGINIEVDLIVR